MDSRPKIICLTPVKNEAWILERFLRCASLWADHIIVADQGSEDDSREIAQRFQKVILIANEAPDYSEVARQRLLIAAAREIEGPRLLIALDADEFLTANYMTSVEWSTLLSATPGTVICFRWLNVHPNLDSYWSPPTDWPWAFMDDGSEHVGSTIHSFRVPLPAGNPILLLREIQVLHYQYTNWDRMQSKHRWYQCWERVNHPQRHAISIYRQYNHMFAVPAGEIKPFRCEWISGYEAQGIDMTSVHRQPYYYWDREVLNMFAQYGTARFKREAIWDWDVDWSDKARQMGMDPKELDLRDPRSPLDRLIHRWLRYTRGRADELPIRLSHFALDLLGW